MKRPRQIYLYLYLYLYIYLYLIYTEKLRDREIIPRLQYGSNRKRQRDRDSKINRWEVSRLTDYTC